MLLSLFHQYHVNYTFAGCKYLVVCLILTGWIGQLKTQTSFHISEPQGLTVKAIVDIRKDRFGTMWIGTYDGLFRHEGARIRNLSSRAILKESTARSEFHSVFEDSRGLIWVASLVGFYKIDPEGLSIKRFFLRPTNGNFQAVGATYAIFEDRSSDLWLSTDMGLYQFDRETEEIRQVPFATDSTGVMNAVTGYKTGVLTDEGLWFHTRGGLVCYNDKAKTFEHQFYNPRGYKALDLVQNEGIGAASYVVADREGAIWFISNHRLLTRFHPSTNQLDTFELPKRKDVWPCCQTLAIDGGQGVWIGFRHGGLLYFNRANRQFIPVEHHDANSLISSNYINALEYDDFGKLWVGSNEGIDILDWHREGISSQKLSQLPEFTNLKHASGEVTIGEDNQLYIPFASYGYFKRDPKNGQITNHKNNEPDQDATVFILSYNGHTYMEQNGGLEVLAENGKRREGGAFLKAFNSAIRRYRGRIVWVDAVGEDHFICRKSSGDIIIFKDDKVAQVLSGFGFSRNYCRAFQPGYFWYIGMDMNLMKHSFDGMPADTIDLNTKLKPTDFFYTNPRDIIDDGTSVWITTQNGVLRVIPEKDSISWYTTDDGLSNNFSFAFALDEFNRLWVSTLRGIDWFDAASQKFVNGIRWPLESYMDAFGSAVRGLDQILYFAVGNKLFSFNPESIVHQRPVSGKLMINLLMVNGQVCKVTTGAPITLTYKENNIFVQYSLVEFTQQDEVRYFYKLGNPLGDWLPDQGNGELTFNALQPGNYQLSLGAVIGSDLNPEEYLTLTLIIRPPFWRTWWFRLIIFLVAMTLAYIFYRYRLDRALELERVRNKIAADLHDDVASTVSSISFYSEFAKSKIDQENVPLIKMLDQIGENARESLETMRDIIWSTQSRFDHLHALKTKIESAAQSLCQSKGIQLIYLDNLQDNKTPLPPLIRRNVYLIAKEAVANAVKHSDCEVLELSIQYNNQSLIVEIIDNGNGFDPDNIRPGNGLENIKSRSDEIGATLTIESFPDEGTRIKFVVRIPEERNRYFWKR